MSYKYGIGAVPVLVDPALSLSLFTKTITTEPRGTILPQVSSPNLKPLNLPGLQAEQNNTTLYMVGGGLVFLGLLYTLTR